MFEASREVNRSTTERRLGTAIVMLGFLLGVAIFLVFRRTDALAGIDLRSVYSSSRCLIAGCNPYDTSATMAQFLKQGGTLAEAGPPPAIGPFLQYFPGYPPSALFYFVPLALLRWPLALYVYMLIGLTLYGIAAYLIARLCSNSTSIAVSLSMAYFLASGTYLLRGGQPGLVAIPLCCIAVWCFLEQRALALGIIAFALSLTLKPHIGGLVLLYFLLSTAAYRKRAWQVIAAAAILSLPGILWASFSPGSRHWSTDLSANVRGMATVGHMSNPGPGNIYASHISDLQSIVSLMHNDASFYNPVVWLICLCPFSIWVYFVITLKPGREKDLLCIAAIASFSLLPFYHRVYDTRLLLLIFPALAVLWQKAPRWRVYGLCFTLYMSFGSSDLYMDHSNPKSSLLAWIHGNRIWVVLLERPLPLSCLILTIFFLIVLSRLFASSRLVADGADSRAGNISKNWL